jgi:hypothetical protein
VRVTTVFVRAGTEKYPNAEDDVAAVFARCLPAVDRRVLVVDNALPPTHVETAGNRTVIGGDNRAWEFSALDRAVAHLGPDLHDCDLVHVATSAFNTLYTGYLDRFTPDVLERIGGRAAFLGHVDCCNDPVHVRGVRSQAWVRTGFFFLPPTELEVLRTCVSVADPSEFFDESSDEPFAASAPLCEAYRRFIVGWLTGEDVGQGVSWHTRLSTSPDGLATFRRKALAILNENLLAVRLRALGCAMVDVTWLAGAVRAAERVDLATPWWEQIGSRDVDRVVPRSR